MRSSLDPTKTGLRIAVSAGYNLRQTALLIKALENAYKENVLRVDDIAFMLNMDTFTIHAHPPETGASCFFGEKKGRRRGQRRFRNDWFAGG